MCVLAIFALHIDTALVRLHNLPDDIQSEPEALVLPRLSLAALEWFEKVRHHMFGYAPDVDDGENDVLRTGTVKLNLYEMVRRAVLQRVANEVGRNLREAVRVPITGEIAVLLKFDSSLREGDLVLPHHALHGLGNVR